jgi:flagellar basal-body rod protein FlgF
MDNSLLVSLSHQIAAQRSLDVIANNLANMNTSAYRRDALKFEEYLEQSQPGEDQKGVQTTAFVQPAGIVRDNSEGRIEATGNPFDLAISGKGYFVVQTANGERYTRDGHFTLNADGTIVTETGDPVMTDGGAVAITTDDGDVTISGDGTISGDQGQIARVRVVQFADDMALTKEGASYYATSQQPTDAESGYKLEQGMLERSNVVPVTEMTAMIDVMRSFQAISNMISAQEELKRKAVTSLGTFTAA